MAQDHVSAVSLDPWQHGERGTEPADDIRARVFTNFRRHMWPIIGQTTLDCLRSWTTSAAGPSLPAAPRWAATPPSRSPASIVA